MTAKIQHRRSVSLVRDLYEAMRIYWSEVVRLDPDDDRSFTAWVNDQLRAAVPDDYLKRGENLARVIKANRAAQHGGST